MKTKHIAVIIAAVGLIAGFTGCASFQQGVAKVQGDITTVNAWAASPQGTAEIRTTEKAAAGILSTVAAFEGQGNTANALYAADTVTQAYGSNPVPVNVITDTLASAPTAAKVIVPLVTKSNSAATVQLITGLANAVAGVQ